MDNEKGSLWNPLVLTFLGLLANVIHENGNGLNHLHVKETIVFPEQPQKCIQNASLNKYLKEALTPSV